MRTRLGVAGATGAAVALAVTTLAPVATAQDGANLVIDSWRNDDALIWQDVLIPAFNAQHPDISVEFRSTLPQDYNGILQSSLEAGTAGDLITCRPFDNSLGLFQAGHLASLNDLEGMANFGDVAKSAWITDDGSDVFCVPMASVIHGFIYNKAIFDELGITELPTTEAEFKAILDQVAEDGTYTPLAMGTKDLWESATMGFQNIGPNRWKGEEGRLALIDGSGKFTDPAYVETLEQLASWAPYMLDDFEGVAYPDTQQFFSLGDAAIYPAGTWDIAFFQNQGVDVGFFGPPVPNEGDQCYISDHTDIAMGINAASPNQEAARTFLNWVASEEFANLYSNALPGFYSLSNASVTIDNEAAQAAVDLRQTCDSTIRNSYQILSRGTPNLEDELWRLSAAVINGTVTPEDAAAELQAGLDSWYTPGA